MRYYWQQFVVHQFTLKGHWQSDSQKGKMIQHATVKTFGHEN